MLRKDFLPKKLYRNFSCRECTFVTGCFVNAMTVGVSTQHDDHLKFLYEGNSEFAVLPTYAVIPAMDTILQLILSGELRGFQFDPAMVVISK